MEHTQLTGLVHLKEFIIKFVLNLNKTLDFFGIFCFALGGLFSGWFLVWFFFTFWPANPLSLLLEQKMPKSLQLLLLYFHVLPVLSFLTLALLYCALRQNKKPIQPWHIRG